MTNDYSSFLRLVLGFLNLRPGVDQRHGAVEHEAAGAGIGIDAVIAEILESLQDRSFARTAHTRDDDEFGGVVSSPLGLLAATLRAPPASGVPAVH